jgi:putative nucleotidyltransferase with HDIG domain
MKRSRLLSPQRREAMTMILWIGVVAIAAEGILGAFLPDRDILQRASRSLLVWLSLGILHYGAQAVMSEYQAHDRKGFTALYILLASSTLWVALTQVIAMALVMYSGLHLSSSGVSAVSLSFALPYAAVVLIVQSIGGSQRAIFAAACATAVYAFYTPARSLNHAIIPSAIFASSVVACLAFRRGVRSRSAYLRGALWVTLSLIPFAIVSMFIDHSTNALDATIRVVACCVSGLSSALFAVALTPILEYFGEYASDMRLIEMATLDHPLLKELSIQAPGTWNHSMVIGMMVESAANVIGANPVVCRVGAYFHDIGKTTKPLYFVENQEPGENRHDKLSPSMSALIIRAHVKDGIELARRHKLPKIIEEMIPQHHGTSLIEYFYEKARKEAEELGVEPETVDRSLYQYPGPRPQTKEAGLLMLADGIEAAARTLCEPTQDRIQGLVQKMINKVFASGELNECELTLHDLHLIARSFTHILTGIYHQRVAYAEPAEKTNERGGDRGTGDSASGADGEAKPENLRRLGIE